MNAEQYRGRGDGRSEPVGGVGVPTHARRECGDVGYSSKVMQQNATNSEYHREQLRDIGKALWEELNSLQREWDLFTAIYWHSKSRTDILDKLFPSCYLTLDKVFQRDIILRVARLGDPAGGGSRMNISFVAVNSRLETDEPSNTIFDKWNALTHRKSVKSLRDRMVAHLDSGVRFGIRECADVEFRQVGQAIQHMKCTLMRLSDYYAWGLPNWDENTIADEINRLMERMKSC